LIPNNFICGVNLPGRASLQELRSHKLRTLVITQIW